LSLGKLKGNFPRCHFLTQKVTKNFGPQSLLPIGGVFCQTGIGGRLDFWSCSKPKNRWISLAYSGANLVFLRFSADPKTVNPEGPCSRRMRGVITGAFYTPSTAKGDWENCESWVYSQTSCDTCFFDFGIQSFIYIMKNLRLNYRYRDAHNYKEFGSVVFANPTRMSVDATTALLRGKLKSEEFFVPQDWGQPRLHVRPYDPAVDHAWKEFKLTDEADTDEREIGEFLEGLVKGYEA
jgi:hypothetical protein